MVTAVVGAAAATAYVFIGLFGVAGSRHARSEAWLFSLACVAYAWMTGITAVLRPLGGEHLWLQAMSTMGSGYAAPALLLYTSRNVAPARPLRRTWLALGLPGTVFGAIALSDVRYLEALRALREDGVVVWEPLLSPWYVAHLGGQVACLLVSTTLAVRGWRSAAPGVRRRGLGWLSAAHLVGWVGAATYGVLPASFGLTWLLPFAAPIAGVPGVLLLYGSLQATDEAAAIASRASRGERQLERVAHALGGISARTERALQEIAAHTEALQRAVVPPGERRARARRALSIATSTAAEAQRLLRFARPSPRHVGTAPLLVTLRAGVTRWGRREDCVVRLDHDTASEAAEVPCLAEPLRVALDAILDNAWRARKPGAVLQVALQVRVECPAAVDPLAVGEPLEGCDAVRVDVVDDGVGMTPAQRDNALIPFYSGTAGREGLGLTDVLSVVRSTGGALAIESHAGRGTRVTLWMPIVPPSRSAAPHDAEALRWEAEVLVLTSDVVFGEAMCLLLDARGHACDVARPDERRTVAQMAVQQRRVIVIDARRGELTRWPMLDGLGAFPNTIHLLFLGGQPAVVRQAAGNFASHRLRSHEELHVIRGVISSLLAGPERQQDDIHGA